jgi:hypothetical protein
MTGGTIRLGILLDSLVQPRWVYEALELALGVPGVELVLVVLNGTAGEDLEHRSLLDRLRALIRNRKHLLAALYDRVDRWRTPDSLAFQPTDMGSLLGNAPVIVVRPLRTAFRDAFMEADILQIRKYQLDVAVRFGFRILTGDVLTIARLGVWSYHHGDSRRYRGGPPGFWEVMEGTPASGAVLQVLSEVLDGGAVLCRGSIATVPFSARKNRERVTLMSVPFLARALRRVGEASNARGSAGLAEQVEPYSHRLYRRAENREMFPALARMAGRYLSNHLLAALTKECWIIGYHVAAKHCGHDVPLLAPYRYRLLEPPPGKYWADPFPVYFEGGRGIFFEQFVERERKGHIAFLELGEKGPLGDPVPVIETDHHLSYPFVFSYKGSLFLMPESGACGRTEIWRAVRFPYEWTLESTILEGLRLRDATLAEVGNRWWLFAVQESEFPGSGDELFLFYGTSPMGPWVPHRRNPVVVDAGCARPAGRLFRAGDSLFRPAQIGTPSYGWGIALQRILTLSERDYEEAPAGRIEPRWRRDVLGIHTINTAGCLSVIDVRLRKWRKPLSSGRVKAPGR